MQPSWDSIAATSTCQRSRISSLSARSLTFCLIRVARPKASGFVSESTSTSALDAAVKRFFEQDSFRSDAGGAVLPPPRPPRGDRTVGTAW